MQIVNTMSGMMVLHARGARRHITAALDLGATPQEIIEATVVTENARLYQGGVWLSKRDSNQSMHFIMHFIWTCERI
jgi:hypothetical protein